MTMYIFGQDSNFYEQRDLHKFLADPKTHIEMTFLIEKAFATAAKADTWISITDAFGMAVYSSPITFFRLLFKE